MRYPPEHKRAARARMIAAGAALAKKAGFAATGMDALAAAAEVTTGALYSHFRSKSALLRALVEHELGRTAKFFTGKSAPEMQMALTWYLSPQHIAHPEKGCALPALGAEIARADDETRERFQALLLEVVASLETGAGSRDKAWAVLAQSVGGVLLARALPEGAAREDLLAAVLAASQKALQETLG
ncbi:Transcriptional regulator [gamma proteobacterium HdN1]|nr:Transcriptional regulator [gamma proteobacterium HdN1]